MPPAPYEVQIARAARRLRWRGRLRGEGIGLLFSVIAMSIAAALLWATSGDRTALAVAILAGMLALSSLLVDAHRAVLNYGRTLFFLPRLPELAEAKMRRLEAQFESPLARRRKAVIATLRAALPLLSLARLDRAVDLFIKASRDPDEGVMVEAQRALARSTCLLGPEGREKVAAEFVQLLTVEREDARALPILIISECEWALTPSARAAFADRVVDLVSAPGWTTSGWAVAHLVVCKDDLNEESAAKLARILVERLTDSDGEVALRAAGLSFMLGEVVPAGLKPPVAEALFALTRSQDEKLRGGATLAISNPRWTWDQAAAARAEARLRELQTDPSKGVRKQAKRGLDYLERDRKRAAKKKGAPER